MTLNWDIAGKTVLITGATSGIGLEAAVELAKRHAHVSIVGRDRGRTEAAAADIVRRAGVKSVQTFLCDFASMADIRRLAAEVKSRHPQLHVLVNNAGGVHKVRRQSVDGFEMTFAVNHLGYFLLTHLLLDVIVASAPARIVTVASIGHRQGSLDFDDMGMKRGYGIMRAYSRSKLANVLFAAELARRLRGTGVTSNSLHPGSVATRIWSGAPNWAKPIIWLVRRPYVLTPAQGGAYIVQLAADPALANTSGLYFETGVAVDPAPLGRDEALARRLWDVSADMVGAG